METKVNIMDLNVDIIDVETLIRKITGFLTNDYLNIVYLISSQTIEKTADNKELREMVECADLVLPGEELLLSMHHVDILETGGMVVNYKSLDPMLKNFAGSRLKFFVIGRNEREAKILIHYAENTYKYMRAADYYYGDLEQNTELVINKINSIAPDILLFALDSPLQEQWIHENNTKFNSKLCFGIGQVIDSITKDYKKPPNWICFIGLEKQYIRFRKKFGWKKIHEKRIFKKKIAHYKNKKGENGHGDNQG